METIERLKLLLNKHIKRDWGMYDTAPVMCLDTYPAVIAIHEYFPELSIDIIFKAVSDNIHIKAGTWTSFIWGYTKCARELNKLLK